ncbi:MAG: hypothetical protein Q7S22_01265 [Candidatus Micrarchaeota archaeon]|nr:hypothetical protein [Candidatus Micrarchaeota archaeon]
MEFSKIVILLLVLSVSASFVHAFSVTDYLLPSENKSSITYNNFTFENSSYSLVKISSKEVFLLKNDQPLRNASAIKPVLKFYYGQAYYPMQSELDAIAGYLTAYNNSRNDGGKFKGKEEAVCSSMLLIDGKIIKNPGGSPIYCDSTVNCTKIIQVFYFSAPYTEGIRQSISYQNAYKYVQQFANASYGNDKLLSNNLLLMQNLNYDNLASSLSQIQSSIPKLRENKQVIETSLFRTPRQNDPADLAQCRKENCFGFCPDFSFNGTALDNLNSSLQSTIMKSAPIINLDSISSSLATATETRLLFISNEKKADYYITVFQSLLSKIKPTIADGDATLADINNPTLRVKVARMKELTSVVNRSIAARDFSKIDADISELDKLNIDTQKTIPAIIELYNSTVTAKDAADSIIFVLDSQDLQGSDKDKFDKLKPIAVSLDNSFNNALTEKQYISFSEAYNSVSSEGNVILKNVRENPVSTVDLKLRAFARRVNNTISNILFSLGVDVSKVSAAGNKNLIIGGFSLITFLSLTTIIILLALSKMNKVNPMLLIAMVLIVILVNALLSGTLYFYLNKTSSDADINEFLMDFTHRNSVSVVTDINDAPNSAIVSMSSCADSLTANLQALNRTVSTYNILGDACIITNSQGTVSNTKTECEIAYANSSVINLKYSPTLVKPTFTSIYESRVYIAGDETFYKSCHIKSIFN